MALCPEFPIKDYCPGIALTTADIDIVSVQLCFSTTIVVIPICFSVFITAAFDIARASTVQIYLRHIAQMFIKQYKNVNNFCSLYIIHFKNSLFNNTFQNNTFYIFLRTKIYVLNYLMRNTKQQKSNLSQVVDQNYANGTLFMTLSTIQSLEQHVRKQINKKQTHESKEFGYYDRYDYSQKSQRDLMLQLINQLMLLAESRKNMINTHKAYMIPENYPLDKIKARLNQSISFFNNFKKQKVAQLSKDCLNILEGKQPLSYKIILEEIRASMTEQKKIGSSFIGNIVRENEHMHQQRENIIKRGPEYSVNSLRFHSNQKQISKRSQIGQTSGKRTNSVSKNNYSNYRYRCNQNY